MLKSPEMPHRRRTRVSLGVTLAMLLIGWLVSAALGGAPAQTPSGTLALESPKTPAADALQTARGDAARTIARCRD